jgi:hypothetical protein
LPINPDTQSVDGEALAQQRAKPQDYRPTSLRHRPVHRPATPAMTVEARICRGSPTASYTLGDGGSHLGPAVIRRNGWTPVTEDEMRRVADTHVDLVDFHDGQDRVQRRIRKVEFRDTASGKLIVLPELPDETLTMGQAI